MNTDEESLCKEDFNRLRNLIYQEAGINLGPDKKTMMEIRLKRRLRSLDISSYGEYCRRVFGLNGKAKELVHLIDVITTNKTDFFRERDHFDYLISRVLPDLGERNSFESKCVIWSAGCSTGEEPYTVAMLLSEYCLKHPGFQFSILATDISTAVLATAAKGIFSSEQVGPVPQDLRRKYFMRSRNHESDLLRVVPEIRAAVDFRRVNFMDGDFGLTEMLEVIFCRNVIIYFDRQTQIRLLERLIAQLKPGGYFFAGHSESLQGMDLPLVPVASSVYRKPR